MIEGLSHITLIVSDLDRMEALLVDILDARKIYDSDHKTFSISQERFFMIGDVWLATMEGPPLAEKTYNHIAFKIPDAEYEAYLDKIKTHGLEIRESRPRVEGEGRSIYFYDHDNHMFELHTGTLEKRLSRYAQDNP